MERLRLADETFRFGYDEINACRRRISSILARRPELRMSRDEDQPLPLFKHWVAEYRQQMDC